MSKTALILLGFQNGILDGNLIYLSDAQVGETLKAVGDY